MTTEELNEYVYTKIVYDVAKDDKRTSLARMETDDPNITDDDLMYAISFFSQLKQKVFAALSKSEKADPK